MITIFFQILGGAGLLLYGIEVMKNSLERVSECSGQRLLQESSKSVMKSIFAGIVVTGINQKSSATTIMVVGMVNTGMMSLIQATAVIIGANIGTTITGQLLAFRFELLAPAIVGIAVIFWIYSKLKRVQYIAEIFIGFGIMFVGMIFMESGFRPLRQLPFFSELILDKPTFPSYLIVILIGFLAVALLRSSSWAIGIMIAMSAQGLMTPEVAVPLILGINIGKCISALRHSKDAGRTAKRAAVIHLLFNLFGAIIVLLFFQTILAEQVRALSPVDLPRQIANLHTLFNLGTGLLSIPFIKVFVMASDRLVPTKNREAQETGNLDVRMLETPGLALAQAYNEVMSLARMSRDSFQASIHCVEEEDDRTLEYLQQNGDLILKAQKDIEVYLVKLAQKPIAKEQHEILNLLLGVTGDMERISDLSINIAELAIYKRDNGIRFSEDAMKEMIQFYEKIDWIIKDVLEAMEHQDKVLANSIVSAEIKIKNMESSMREAHINRLSSGVCNPGSGVLFIDLINSMEHVAQHVKKIGYFVIEYSKY